VEQQQEKEVAEASPTAPIVDAIIKKKRGRPKGSKNKPRGEQNNKQQQLQNVVEE